MSDRWNLLKSETIHETLKVGVLLALIGGFLDAYTYLLRGGVFANAQTGNMVLLGLKVAKSDFGGAAFYLIPIFAFFVGVLVTEYIKKSFTNLQIIEWQHIVIGIEILLLFIIGFMPKTVPNPLVNVLISFICSMQVNSFRKISKLPYSSTMCTGNLRSAAEYFYTFLSTKDQAAGKICAVYFIIIAAFCIGAMIGAVLTGLWKEKAVWTCCLTLLMVLIIMFKEQ